MTSYELASQIYGRLYCINIPPQSVFQPPDQGLKYNLTLFKNKDATNINLMLEYCYLIMYKSILK